MDKADRICTRFASLKAEHRPGLIAFLTAGDPDFHTSLGILRGLPPAGVDLIELGIPFSDPMADGPEIQRANLRALHAGATLDRVLAEVEMFREGDNETPVILIGYFNPIDSFGIGRFLAEARRVGVDGLIVVDLPPEEDEELCLPARRAGLSFIRMVTPTTDEPRLGRLLAGADGFLYHVSLTGVTGVGAPAEATVRTALARIRCHTDLPIAVGFGIRTPDQAELIGRSADAVVVGSAIVERIATNIDERGMPGRQLVADVLGFVRELSLGLFSSRTRS